MGPVRSFSRRAIREMKAACLVFVLACGCADEFSLDGHAVDPDEYAEATTESPVRAPRRLPPTCRVTSTDINFVTIDCRYAGSPTPKDWRAGMTAELRLAAQTSVIAGKTAIALVGRETPDVRTANYTSPVACVRSVNGLRTAAVILGGMGGAYQEHAHCSSSGSDTNCTFIPAQPVPDIHDTTCVGGTTTTYISSVITRSRWRLLTDVEAAAPQMELLPDVNKPIDCEILLAPGTTPRPSRAVQEGASASVAKPVVAPDAPLPKPTEWKDPFVDAARPSAEPSTQ
jgi:hypothetical protein